MPFIASSVFPSEVERVTCLIRSDNLGHELIDIQKMGRSSLARRWSFNIIESEFGSIGVVKCYENPFESIKFSTWFFTVS